MMQKIFRPVTWSALTRVGITVLLAALAVFFPLRLLYVALTVGENNLSNDYLVFTGPVLWIASEGLRFEELKDTCFGLQCEPMTFLLMGLGVRYFEWNIRAEIIFSVFIAMATVFLLYFSIAGITFRLERLWLLVFISAFSFSFTMMSTYTFGQSAIYSTIAFLGISLGLFAVKIWPDTWKGIFAIVIGMWISVWSYGAGMFAIPILFLGLLVGFRKTKYYLGWFFSFLLINIPYWQFLAGYKVSLTSARTFPSFFRYQWITKLLGLFFSNEVYLPYPGKQPIFSSNPLVYGFTGIMVLCLGLWLMFRHYKMRHISLFYTELALISFGLGPILLVSLFREGIAPWYIANSLPFWIGILFLYYSLITNEGISQFPIGNWVKRFAYVLLFIATVLFLHSNITYQDKIFHLLTRAPASASCLRHSLTAPTYCESLLFQWTPGYPASIERLGRPLRENGLSVYSSKQEWTLQGDFLLNSVEVFPSSEYVNPFWVDAKNIVSSWNDYHRLNLVLPSDSEITWAVQIPDQLETAEFKFSLGIFRPGNPSEYQGHAPWDLLVKVTDENKQVYVFQYELNGRDFSGDSSFLQKAIPLEQFSGQKIKISLSAMKNDTQAGDLLLQTPLIYVFTKRNPSGSVTGYQPENVLNIESPASFIQLWPPKEGEERNVLFNNMKADKHNFYKKSGDAYMTFDNGNGYCVYNSTNLFITMSVDEAISYRYGNFLLRIEDINGQMTYAQFNLPFLPDSNLHTYIYPMKLHLATSPSYIEDIVFRPLGYPDRADFRIERLGFFDTKEDLAQCLLNTK